MQTKNEIRINIWPNGQWRIAGNIGRTIKQCWKQKNICLGVKIDEKTPIETMDLRIFHELESMSETVLVIWKLIPTMIIGVFGLGLLYLTV